MTVEAGAIAVVLRCDFVLWRQVATSFKSQALPRALFTLRRKLPATPNMMLAELRTIDPYLATCTAGERLAVRGFKHSR